MRYGARAFEGRLELRPFESEALRDNPLGDPHVREVPVYVPRAAEDGTRLPVVFLLAGFTGRGQSMLETHPWRRGVVSEYDRALARGEAPPAILVLPDAFTRYGGSQYVDSSAVGRYAEYVGVELPAFVDAHYSTLPDRRAVAGKSSGGFGALHIAMRHPGTFVAAASIAGDAHFEFGYGADFLNGVRGLEKAGGPAAFLAVFDEFHDLSGDGHAALNLLAMSACYSPNPESELGFDLPVDLETGERKDEVWQRWLAFDPVVACERYADELKQLRLLYLEAGTRDEFHLQFSARILARRLRELDVPHEHVELDGGHFGMDARWREVLPKLVRALE
ncbi:MAG: esterase family protein [bacterium]|nr:esterase family protein [bacterium]